MGLPETGGADQNQVAQEIWRIQANLNTRPTLNIRYPGQYYDFEAGLVQNWWRTYEPRLGRYVSADPIGLDGGWNRFGYAKGNSLKYVDPLGLLNLVVGGGGSYVPGIGTEGSAGIYVTLPQYRKYNFDIGVWGSGGLGAGANIGLSAQAGFIKGDKCDIKGVTYNVNAGAAVGSGTLMFDDKGNLVGGTIGPAADLGVSASYAKSGAIGLSDLGSWLGIWLYNKFH